MIHENLFIAHFKTDEWPAKCTSHFTELIKREISELK